jgi:hypothetical protein
MGESPQNFFQRLFGGGNKDNQNQPANPQQPNTPEPPKKNFFQKLFGGGNKQPAPVPQQ